MPVHETKGGYKYGETGKTYKNKKDAIKQAVAIAYSKARKKGRKPTNEEVEQEITGMDKVAAALRKIAQELPQFSYPNMPTNGPLYLPNNPGR